MVGGVYDDDEGDLADWYNGDFQLVYGSPKPRSEELTELLGRAGNAYTRGNKMPPFHLGRYVEWLIDTEIEPAFILNQILTHLPCESRLDDFYDLVVRRWAVLTRRPPKETGRFWKRSAPPEKAENDRGTDTPRSPTPAPAQPAQPVSVPRRPGKRAEALLQAQLAEGREVETTVMEREARRAGIPIITLNRARARLKIVSRRRGYGRGGKFWLSLPEPNTP